MYDDRQPSIRLGIRSAARMWALVLTVWVVAGVFLMPAGIAAHNVGIEALGSVPEDFRQPAGEEAVLIWGTLRDFGPMVLGGMVFAVIGTWFWTVLWHGGVARATVWDQGGSSAPSRVLGLGVGAWWRYCRLSLVALTMLIGSMAVIWIPLSIGIKSSFQAMAEDRGILLIGVGIVLAAMVKIVVWSATLRGAWLLARHDRKSALLAWFRGLSGALMHPVSTVVTVLVLGIGHVALVFLPLLAPIALPQLRGTPAGTILGLGAGLGAVFFSVALFAAFAPVSGLVEREKNPAETAGP